MNGRPRQLDLIVSYERRQLMQETQPETLWEVVIRERMAGTR